MSISGLVGERRALALASLGFFGSLYVIAALTAPAQWGPMLWSLAACYAVAFMALGAEWFWGRWFASGIGWSGLMMALMSIPAGLNGILVFYGITHGLVVACLMGRPMAEKYELRPQAGAQLGLDEEGMARLGKTVQRAATALPSLLAFALAPREDQALAALVAAAGTFGLWALVRGRAVGWLALPAAAAGVVAIGGPYAGYLTLDEVSTVMPAPVVAGLLLLAAAPLGGTVLRFLCGRRS